MITYKYATEAWGWLNIMKAKTENFYQPAFKGVFCGCGGETLITQYVTYNDKVRAQIKPCCVNFKEKVNKALQDYVEEHGRYNTGFDCV